MATQTNGPPNSAFLTVEYSEDARTSTGVITLHFDVSVFTPPTPSNDDERRSQQMRLLSAFRSLAELGYADKATLTVRGCTFDFRKLIGKGLGAPLAYGLVDNATASQWTHDLSQLASQCRKRLTDSSAQLDFVIKLSQSETATFRNCNLLEFSIQVARSDAASPVTAAKATVLRLDTQLGKDPQKQTNKGYGRDGQNTKPGKPEDVSAYPSWQSAMLARKRPLVPLRQNSQGIRDVFASGSDPNWIKSNSGTSWLAPSGIPAVAGDWPDMYAFALGFLPLQRSKALGSATTAITRRFFDALAFVIDARPGAWNQGWSLANWRTHFDNLRSAAPNLVATQKAALSLLQPANDPNALDPANLVPEQIRTFVRSSSRWTAAIDQLVVEAPGIFGSAKAVQITGIGKKSNATAIRADLFRISQEHLIPAPPASGTSAARTTEVLRSTDIRQGLPDPSGTGSFFGINVLDDVSYGNRYTLSDTAAQSFEALVDPAATAAPVSAYVPEASGKPIDPVIALPSREPLTLPQHFFTGLVTGATTPDWWDKKDDKGNVQPISAGDLIAHKITHVLPSSTDALEFIAGGSLPRKSPVPPGRIDRSFVCGVFSVSSDEEGSFENDTFSILYDPSQQAGNVSPEDNKPDGFFGSLLSVPP